MSIKVMTVADLAAYLRTIPNQNLPIQIVAMADLMSVVTGDVAYVEAGKRAVKLHCHGSLDFLDDDDLLDDDYDGDFIDSEPDFMVQ